MGLATRSWTVAERDRLPDDGNRYEVVDGELFVTPMPAVRHQIIVKRLCHALEPFVEQHKIGSVFGVGTDVIFNERNAVVPDVAVYPVADEQLPKKWKDAPNPILVAEVRSDSTWRRDVGPKRALYIEREIPVYWIVDEEDRDVTIVRPGHEDVVVRDVLRWRPAGVNAALELRLDELFR